MECGVKWVAINEPTFMKLDPWQVGVLSSAPAQMVYNGLEDE
jgi:hypothetical protein